MRSKGTFTTGAIIAAVLAGIVLAQTYDAGTELALVEKLAKARDDYKATLSELYNYYLRTGDNAKSSRAEAELKALTAVPQADYANVTGEVKEPIKVLRYVEEAEDCFIDGKSYAGSNRREIRDRAIKRFEKVLNNWPDSIKAPAAAFELGELYAGYYYRDFDRAAKYFMKCYEIDPATMLPALVRAGDMYQKVDRTDEAIRIYKLAVQGSADPKAKDRAQAELDRLAKTGK